MVLDHNSHIGIQMNWKELTKTFMQISNWSKTSSLHDLNKNISALKGLRC